MISKGFKRLANDFDMQISKGIAYGEVGGYCFTFRDGMGTKNVSIGISFNGDGNDRAKIFGHLYENQKKFAIKNFNYEHYALTMLFHDTFGTLKRINEFINTFIVILKDNQIKESGFCAACGNSVTYEPSETVLLNGNAIRLHNSCMQKISDKNESFYTKARSTKKEGSTVRGLIGALIGAFLGAIPWAVVLYFGYITSLVGVVIGFCIKKGYELFGGKQGTAKLIIMLVLVIPTVILGEYLGILFGVWKLIADGEMIPIAFKEINQLIFLFLSHEPTELAAVIKEILMGSLFAYLGIFAIAKNIHKENRANSAPHIQRLIPEE